MHYYQNGSLPPTEFTVDAMNQQLSTFQTVERAIVYQRDADRQLQSSRRGGRGGAAARGARRTGQGVALLLDEWGVWDRLNGPEQKKYGQLWQQSTMRSAVAAGLGLNIFNRQADKLYMCNIAQIVNVLQSLLLTDGPTGQNCVKTTTYHAFALFKPHRSKTAVKVESGGTRSAGSFDVGLQERIGTGDQLREPEDRRQSPDRLLPGRPDGEERDGPDPDSQGLQRREHVREPERDRAAIASDPGGRDVGKAGPTPDVGRDGHRANLNRIRGRDSHPHFAVGAFAAAGLVDSFLYSAGSYSSRPVMP